MFLQFAELGFVKAISLSVTFNSEDIFESVSDPMKCARRFDQIVSKTLVFGRLVIQRRHLGHVEFREALVEHVDAFGVFAFVGGGFHDRVGHFHVGEGVQHGGLFAEDLIIVDCWRAVAAEFVGDCRVVLV